MICLLYCIIYIIAVLLSGFGNHNSLPLWCNNILFLISLFKAMSMINNQKN